LSFDPGVVVAEGPWGEMEGEERQSAVVLLEALLRKVNPKLLTSPSASKLVPMSLLLTFG